MMRADAVSIFKKNSVEGRQKTVDTVMVLTLTDPKHQASYNRKPGHGTPCQQCAFHDIKGHIYQIPPPGVIHPTKKNYYKLR